MTLLGELGLFAFVPRVLDVAEVIPGPAVEAAGLDAADVIRHEAVAERVALVHAHPEIVRAGAELDADGVAHAPGEDFLAGAIGIELEDAWRGRLRLLSSETFDFEPMETYIFLPSGEKVMSRVQCPPPWSSPPSESSALSFSTGPRALRSPLRYGKRTTPSVFAT